MVKAMAQQDRAAGRPRSNVIRDGLAFRQNGETFIVRTAMDVNLLQNGIERRSVATFTTVRRASHGRRRAVHRRPPGGPPGCPPPATPADPAAAARRLQCGCDTHDPPAGRAWPPGRLRRAARRPRQRRARQRRPARRGGRAPTRRPPALRPHRPALGSRPSSTTSTASSPRSAPRRSSRCTSSNSRSRDLYGDHWSLTGVGVPAAGTPDEDVFLPGRNVLLLAEVAPLVPPARRAGVAMAPLAANPFPDATPEFFDDFSAVGEPGGRAARVRVIRPYADLHKTGRAPRGPGCRSSTPSRASARRAAGTAAGAASATSGK